MQGGTTKPGLGGTPELKVETNLEKGGDRLQFGSLIFFRIDNIDIPFPLAVKRYA